MVESYDSHESNKSRDSRDENESHYSIITNALKHNKKRKSVEERLERFDGFKSSSACHVACHVAFEKGSDNVGSGKDKEVRIITVPAKSYYFWTARYYNKDRPGVTNWEIHDDGIWFGMDWGDVENDLWALSITDRMRLAKAIRNFLIRREEYRISQEDYESCVSLGDLCVDVHAVAEALKITRMGVFDYFHSKKVKKHFLERIFVPHPEGLNLGAKHELMLISVRSIIKQMLHKAHKARHERWNKKVVADKARLYAHVRRYQVTHLAPKYYRHNHCNGDYIGPKKLNKKCLISFHKPDSEVKKNSDHGVKIHPLLDFVPVRNKKRERVVAKGSLYDYAIDVNVASYK